LTVDETRIWLGRCLRDLPDEIDMPPERITEEVAGAFAEDLVGDISISDAHILGLGGSIAMTVCL